MSLISFPFSFLPHVPFILNKLAPLLTQHDWKHSPHWLTGYAAEIQKIAGKLCWFFALPVVEKQRKIMVSLLASCLQLLFTLAEFWKTDWGMKMLVCDYLISEVEQIKHTNVFWEPPPLSICSLRSISSCIKISYVGGHDQSCKTTSCIRTIWSATPNPFNKMSDPRS